MGQTQLYKFATNLTRGQKQLILLFADVLTIPVAMFVALAIQYIGRPVPYGLLNDWEIIPVLMVLSGSLSYALGMNRIQLNDTETAGPAPAALHAVVVGLAAALLNMVAGSPVHWSAYFTFGLILFVGTVAIRLMMRRVFLAILHMKNPRTGVLIYGAGRTGMQLATALRHDPRIQPVAFIDDNPAMRRMTVAGMPVIAPKDIEDLIRKKNIQRVLLAMPSLSAPQKMRISKRLTPLGLEVQALPSFAQLAGEEELVDKLKPVQPADFLPRKQFDDDLATAMPVFRGKTVLVTGAGGSIGSELCRQLLHCRPARIVLLDSSELALYTIDGEMNALSTGVEIVPMLGSVTDARVCRDVLEAHGVQIVLHAAAYKHVPLVERNPLTGLFNNVFGSRTMAEAAREYGVERFMLVSTDKAVRPTNVMGASKRMAEMIVQDMASRPGDTRFSIVRFGNVLGSSGSVIPLFEEQIANGGPVTLTHADVTRYFMTIPEAARLVVVSAAMARGGDVFVLDMGRPVPIRELAHQMIEMAGYTVRDDQNPDGDIEIKITGLRLGEKLHEELLIGEEFMTTQHPKITRAREICLSEIEIATALKDLRNAIDVSDPDAAREVLARWVEGSMRPAQGQVG
ncbi:polysaccharide biosynthesis protein [Qingshengfaniella alkalisoli]|uniref:Polysaccharide biosynthesis protein n=1 Tax=Qingshengfaniella alkalisoli TaxID=2599296 RepID=A0A5B8IWP5_9RHOB|nr:nucleoside-diphosphate sugar epimerase/dehydratase [Qingshengfaniella alkalisoli]QDY70104.1 polysaccharide biosynthesis protein [Qingshengfaniella alkalisoli]